MAHPWHIRLHPLQFAQERQPRLNCSNRPPPSPEVRQFGAWLPSQAVGRRRHCSAPRKRRTRRQPSHVRWTARCLTVNQLTLVESDRQHFACVSVSRGAPQLRQRTRLNQADPLARQLAVALTSSSLCPSPRSRPNRCERICRLRAPSRRQESDRQGPGMYVNPPGQATPPPPGANSHHGPSRCSTQLSPEPPNCE